VPLRWPEPRPTGVSAWHRKTPGRRVTPLNAGTVSNVLGTLERDQGLAQVTRLYADPGTEVIYGSSSTGITGGRCDITISGVYALQ